MKKILFVCLGNICRSPSSEGVMERLLRKEGLDSYVYCDSAGTSSCHEGERADARMREHAEERGYVLDTFSRGIEQDDFEDFDYIIAMDDSNYDDLMNLCPAKRYENRIFKMTAFCESKKDSEVPDPYYGGDDGFEDVLDILEDAAKGLLKELKAS